MASAGNMSAWPGDYDRQKEEKAAMKLKTRIILGFTMIILMPLLLFAATLYGFSQSQKTQVQTESDGTVYDISIIDSADSQGRVHVMAKDLFISAFIILISVALVVGLWVYRSIAVPLVKLKKRRRISKREILTSSWMWKEMMNFQSYARILRRCAAV